MGLGQPLPLVVDAGQAGQQPERVGAGVAHTVQQEAVDVPRGLLDGVLGGLVPSDSGGVEDQVTLHAVGQERGVLFGDAQQAAGGAGGQRNGEVRPQVRGRAALHEGGQQAPGRGVQPGGGDFCMGGSQGPQQFRQQAGLSAQAAETGHPRGDAGEVLVGNPGAGGAHQAEAGIFQDLARRGVAGDQPGPVAAVGPHRAHWLLPDQLVQFGCQPVATVAREWVAHHGITSSLSRISGSR
ncbi:hypothetical protein A6A06_25565 [Streptomyces sp. CB02923]|uniref:hypothetical protein n=1 Tax=Streptomyces sp. CB02923 TaxID=1718985 RepID=UPI00093D48E4|nr:hypothetical protein [Streptomyces sp. CB02923]OKH98973.1 hypothetical protein A6A06_25565 [Streptomyces sp. CB02923]